MNKNNLFGKIFKKKNLKKINCCVGGEWFDYDAAIVKFPWIIQKNMLFVVSPDADGFYCAMLLTHFNQWKCVGFYNDRVLLLKDGVDEDDVVYIDVEMFDASKKSMGNHSLLPKTIKNFKEHIDESFSQCFNPNLIKGVTHGNYSKKFPYGTAHILLSVLSWNSNGEMSEFLNTPQKAVTFAYADGMLKTGLKYPENSLEWFKYLRFTDEWNPLRKLYELSYMDLIEGSVQLHNTIHEYDTNKQRGDKLSVTSKGKIHACYQKENGLYAIKEDNKGGIIAYLKKIYGIFDLEYCEDQWDCWDNLSMIEYEKKETGTSNKNFQEMFLENPISYAATSTATLSYTVRRN